MDRLIRILDTPKIEDTKVWVFQMPSVFESKTIYSDNQTPETCVVDKS